MSIYNIYGYMNGIPVYIVRRGYLKQKKTSHNRILNFIFRIVFGLQEVYMIEDDEIITLGHSLHMNPNTYKKLKCLGLINCCSDHAE